LVHHDLKLDYSWLPTLHVTSFAAKALGELTGELHGPLRITPGDEMKQLPPGRRAKDEGRHIARDVEWFYRAEIKAPPDSIRSLAGEYAVTVQRTNDARSAVQNGIKRAKPPPAAPAADTSPAT
jgi:hypothetical protein